MSDSLYLPIFSALLGADVTQGYAVTSNAGGTAAVTATTAAIAASISGVIEGISIQSKSAGQVVDVQRVGRVPAVYVPWLGTGIAEACVVDLNGKPQRASAAAGTVIGLVDKQGNIWLSLPLGVLAYQTLYYQTIQANGVDKTQRTKLNFSNEFVVTDSGGVTNVALTAAATGANLNGLVWTLPNLGSLGTDTCTCPFGAQVTAQMDGVIGQLYSVTVRIRGVAEIRSYVGGTRTGRLYQAGYKDPANGGGLSAIQNVYRVEIEDPADYYWLNAWDGSETATNRCFGIDFSTTFSIRGGAWVRLVAISDYEYTTDIPSGAYTASQQKNKDGAGTPITVGGGGVLVSEPYDGQWMQMDVTAVA